MTERKEMLKQMVNNLINDRQEEAALDFHNYLAPKAREVIEIDTYVDNSNFED